MVKELNLLQIVEPGGQGGVYQHVLGGIQNGIYENYRDIILHTAKDAELTPPIENVTYCQCMRYQRLGPRRFRATVSLLWVIGVVIPHLMMTMLRRGGDWEIQGLFGKGIYAIFVLIPKLGRRQVTFVPHNSFSRTNNVVEYKLLQFALRSASKVVVFVDAETGNLSHARALERRRLWQYVLDVDENTIDKWKNFMDSAEKPVIAFIGQLRKDKNPQLLLEAAGLIEAPLSIIFAGQDKGAVQSIREFPLDRRHNRIILDSYLESADFQAILMASSVVVCPYAIASQSGVVALAAQLGTPVVASNVGGLVEQADFTFDVGGDNPAKSLADVLRAVLLS